MAQGPPQQDKTRLPKHYHRRFLKALLHSLTLNLLFCSRSPTRMSYHQLSDCCGFQVLSRFQFFREVSFFFLGFQGCRSSPLTGALIALVSAAPFAFPGHWAGLHS